MRLVSRTAAGRGAGPPAPRARPDCPGPTFAVFLLLYLINKAAVLSCWWAVGTSLGGGTGGLEGPLWGEAQALSTTRTPETSLPPPHPPPRGLGAADVLSPRLLCLFYHPPTFSSPQVPTRLPPSSGDAPDEPRESQNARPSDLRLCDAGRTSSESGAAPHRPSQDESCRVSQPVIDPRSWGALAHTYRGVGAGPGPVPWRGPLQPGAGGVEKVQPVVDMDMAGSWRTVRGGSPAGASQAAAKGSAAPRTLPVRLSPSPDEVGISLAAHFLSSCRERLSPSSLE